MDANTLIVGNHVYFQREVAESCDRDNKPASDDAYVDFGIIEKVAVEPTSETKEIWAPNPGHLELYDELEYKKSLKYTLTGLQVTNLMFELLFGTAALSGDTAVSYTPNAKTTTLKGWIHVKQYDQNDALFNDFYDYVNLKITGAVEFGEDAVTFDAEARHLMTSYSTGTLYPSST